MKTTKFQISIVAAAVIACYAGYVAWRAHTKLVTLHVHNVPFEKVMAQVRWQTWERFEWHKDVKGKVTLDLDRMPLEQVLPLIGEQVSARVATVYPLYRSKTALASLDSVIQGKIQAGESRFTNWQAQASGGRGAGRNGWGGPGQVGPAEQTGVSLVFANKTVEIAALSLSRAGHAEVVPEDGITARVNLKLESKPLEAAVSAVAKAAQVSWTKLYAFEPMGRGFGGPGGRQFAGAGTGGDREGMTPELREVNELRMKEVMETLPSQEQEKAKENQEKAEVMRELPAEARQQLMAERMNSPDIQQRMEQRSTAGVKNSTPDQRRERFQRIYQMRQARAAGIAVGGPGRKG